MAKLAVTDDMHAAAHEAGTLLAAGDGPDIDEAFDAAVSEAYADPAGPSAGFVAADPGALTTFAGPYSVDEAMAAALAWARNAAPGDVAGFAVLGRSAHSRVTRRARLEDATLEVPSGPGAPWLPLDDAMSTAVDAAGAGPLDGETLERVTFTRRARYKAVAEAFKGKMAGEFVVLDGDRILSRGHATAGAAKKAAVETLKALPTDDHRLVQLSVFKLSGREGNLPLQRVVRTRIKQVIAAKLVYAARKETARDPKVVGWLFVTVPGHPDNSDA